MVCAQKGYPLVVTMAESFSFERRKMMRFMGLKVVLTPASLKGSGMLAKATELAEKHGWFLVRQFENEANADAHSRTTAPEILEAFASPTTLPYSAATSPRNGWTMAQLLKDNNVAWTESADRDPYSFLPGWLHTR